VFIHEVEAVNAGLVEAPVETVAQQVTRLLRNGGNHGKAD
jgi:hypothetical protein